MVIISTERKLDEQTGIKIMEFKIRRLTKNQLRVLLKIIESSDKDESGKSNGGIKSALYRNGLIRPLGRAEHNIRVFHWEITWNVKSEEIALIKNILAS